MKTWPLTICLCALVCTQYACDSKSGTSGAPLPASDAALSGDIALSDGGGSGAGCSEEMPCPAGQQCDPVTRTCKLSCAADGTCGANLVCNSAGLCIEPQTCMEKSECAAGQTCDCLGRCVALSGAECRGNLQCETTEYCEQCSGQCRERAPQCGACFGDDGCDPRSVCVGYRDSLVEAGRPAGYCARRCQGECDVVGPEYECLSVSGVMACVPRAGICSETAQCEQDSECPPDRFCNERGECQPGCIDDTGCPSGELCQGLRCAPPCVGDMSCLDGQVCSDDGRCRIPNGCTSSLDCTMAETYCDRSVMMCVSGCQVDNDCLDANLECVAGSCRERGCSANYQCAFGQVCNQQTNMCEDAAGNHCAPGCDPQSQEPPCGNPGSYCLSLQDRDENPIGDFCFEPCEAEPNECPKGYTCLPIMDDMGNEQGRVCTTDCSLLMMQ